MKWKNSTIPIYVTPTLNIEDMSDVRHVNTGHHGDIDTCNYRVWYLFLRRCFTTPVNLASFVWRLQIYFCNLMIITLVSSLEPRDADKSTSFLQAWKGPCLLFPTQKGWAMSTASWLLTWTRLKRETQSVTWLTSY